MHHMDVAIYACRSSDAERVVVCSHVKAEAGAGVVHQLHLTFLQRLPTPRGHLPGSTHLDDSVRDNMTHFKQ